jgi:hypothetical protein
MEINNPKYNIGDTVCFKYHGFLSIGKVFKINIEISEDKTEISYWIETKNSTFSIKEEFITKVNN